MSDATPALNPTTDKPALDVDTIAARFGVSRRTVRRLITSGELAAFRVGVQYRVTETALADYIAKQAA